MITTQDKPRARQASRKSLLRPYTSSAATQKNRSPSDASFVTCAIAISGFVANARPSGIRAFARAPFRVVRPGVLGHVQAEPGPRLRGRGDQRCEYPGHAVLHPASHPRVLRGHARGRLPALQVRSLVDGQARPDLIIGVIAQGLLRQGGQHVPAKFP